MGSLLAARVEHVTNGAVTRKELRPNDWHLIWPELKDEAVGKALLDKDMAERPFGDEE